MKLLFTSVGRRVELIQAFKNASKELNIELTIYGTDISDTAPALFFCDKIVKICRINDEKYVPLLLDFCKKENIDALIPTIDTDLLILSANKTRFEIIGTNVLISAEDKIRICRDKRETANFFESVGLKSPTPIDDYKNYTFGFPAFIKPKDGSSSINTYKVINNFELKAFANEVPNYIVSPFIEGEEYTVDVFCDFEGNPIFITPRIRIAVRSGEVLKTQIVQDKRIIEETKRIIRAFKPCGPITIQLIRQQSSGDDYFIEINPRFGGGAPLSMKAGADSSKALLRLLAGENVNYQNVAATDGAIYSRFDQSVRVK